MCNNTKQRIADAVEELLCTQSTGKVTIQQVMELTQMNRQSFYYHYQDINDVLRRIVNRKFSVPLAFQPQEDTDAWCLRALTLLRENKTLLRRIARELGDGELYRLVLPVVWPQVDRLIPTRPDQDPQQRKLAVDTICRSILYTVCALIQQQQPIDVDASRRKLRAVLAVLGANRTGS